MIDASTSPAASAPSKQTFASSAAASGSFSPRAVGCRGPNAGPLPLTDLSRPLPATLTVRAALDQYLAENGFEAADYTSPTVRLKILGRYVDFPNTKDRQWAIPLHDLHHLATGYGTDFVGEAEIGVWELRAGCRKWIVYYLNATAAFIGLFLSPRRMLSAWRAAKGATAIYRQALPYEDLLSMTVGDLRSHLGIPPDGLADRPRHLHSDAEANRAQQRAGAMAPA